MKLPVSNPELKPKFFRFRPKTRVDKLGDCAVCLDFWLPGAPAITDREGHVNFTVSYHYFEYPMTIISNLVTL